MEIISAANHWAKGEITSSIFFMLFGVTYLLIAFYFKQMGTAALHKSLFIPMLVAGGLLLMAGISFYFSNKSKLANFEKDFTANPTAMIQAEIASTNKTIKTYQNVALKVFPAIILVTALIAIFVSNTSIRAICIGVVAFLFVLVLLDSQALKRMNTYNQHLVTAERAVKN